jgi:hypothetical protein
MSQIPSKCKAAAERAAGVSPANKFTPFAKARPRTFGQDAQSTLFPSCLPHFLPSAPLCLCGKISTAGLSPRFMTVSGVTKVHPLLGERAGVRASGEKPTPAPVFSATSVPHLQTFGQDAQSTMFPSCLPAFLIIFSSVPLCLCASVAKNPHSSSRSKSAMIAVS